MSFKSMKQIVTSVTRGGQITLPAEVRKLLGVKALDKVAFTIEGNDVRIVPLKYTLETAAGSVKPATKTEDIDALIAKAKEETAAKPFGK